MKISNEKKVGLVPAVSEDYFNDNHTVETLSGVDFYVNPENIIWVQHHALYNMRDSIKKYINESGHIEFEGEEYFKYTFKFIDGSEKLLYVDREFEKVLMSGRYVDDD